ncbi:hypothetical protein TELCIR_22489 [Teladorsagia circumcincta]|uniref:Uncharacterized protein n=1 Tax=Teladorsagia circumcincta TaxID=45464 RepID=A0A2G9TDR2_TELCI|nr:hypothetical protein TELCIR_22489 [Teladorsagia circumcincta]
MVKARAKKATVSHYKEGGFRSPRQSTARSLKEEINLESAGNVIFCKENDSIHLRGMISKMVKAMKQDGALAIAQLSHVRFFNG